MKKVAYLLASAALMMSAIANAAVTWDWSFAGEAGTFTTDGTAPGNVAAPGIYNFTDFSVTSSAFGRPVGSVSGGQYLAGGFSTVLPYSFTWNGSAVTFWDSAGFNTFNWWVFTSTANSNDAHFFAYAPGNINDPTSAALYNGGEQSSGRVTVSVAGATGAVPEPATWAMMLAGFGIIGGAMRRRQRVSVSFG